MSVFTDFEATVDDIVDNDNDELEQNAASDSDINDFIDDETQIDDNLEDYFAFTNVSRSVEDAMQDSFLNLDKFLLPTEEGGEASNYCHDNYDPNEDETDEFRDSARQVGELKRTLFCP